MTRSANIPRSTVQKPPLRAITDQRLTGTLAEQIMGWTVGPKRFSFRQRGWIPHWRFQPTERIEDAFRLLDALDPLEYALRKERNDIYHVEVRTTGAPAEASGSSLPLVICLAIARACGIPVEACE